MKKYIVYTVCGEDRDCWFYGCYSTATKACDAVVELNSWGGEHHMTTLEDAETFVKNIAQYCYED